MSVTEEIHEVVHTCRMPRRDEDYNEVNMVVLKGG